MMDEQLQLAVSQTIDALSFLQTHTVDTDFRAHSKTTIDSVLSLQREQRNRIEHTYGPKPPTLDYLTNHLLASYRGEAASLIIAREAGDASGSPFVHSLSDAHCQAIKKTIKRRIHEWENAFSEVHGSEPKPHNKLVIRPIYDLYKVVKTRVTTAEAEGRLPKRSGPQPTQAPAQPQPQAQLQPQTTSSYKSVGSSVDDGEGLAKSNSVGTSTASRASPISRSSTLLPATSSASAPSGGGSRGATATDTTRPLSAPVLDAGAASKSDSVKAISTSPASSAGQSSKKSRRFVPIAQMSIEEIFAEKRYLKRFLYQYESEIERRSGRRPTREEQAVFSDKYHRFNELRNFLEEYLRDTE